MVGQQPQFAAGQRLKAAGFLGQGAEHERLVEGEIEEEVRSRPEHSICAESEMGQKQNSAQQDSAQPENSSFQVTGQQFPMSESVGQVIEKSQQGVEMLGGEVRSQEKLITGAVLVLEQQQHSVQQSSAQAGGLCLQVAEKQVPTLEIVGQVVEKPLQGVEVLGGEVRGQMELGTGTDQVMDQQQLHAQNSKLQAGNAHLQGAVRQLPRPESGGKVSDDTPLVVGETEDEFRGHVEQDIDAEMAVKQLQTGAQQGAGQTENATSWAHDQQDLGSGIVGQVSEHVVHGVEGLGGAGRSIMSQKEGPLVDGKQCGQQLQQLQQAAGNCDVQQMCEGFLEVS